MTIGRVVRGILLALLCLLVFVAPSAYIVSRGWPWWRALAVGLAAFPVAPLAWHALGERARRRAPPKSPLTKGWERLLLRAVAVGVVVIGALAVTAGGRAWKAVKHHALWFIPHSTGPLVADSPLFDKIPASAKGVAWLRDPREARDALAEALPLAGGFGRVLDASELVAATDGKDGMFVGERGDIELVEILGDIFREMSTKFGGEKPMFIDDPVVDGDVRFWSTRRWNTTDSRRRLLAVVEEAPADAVFVAAAIDERDVEEGLVYVHIRANRLIVVLEGRATSDAAADKAFASLREAEDKLDDNTCWRRYGRASTDRDGHDLSFAASFDLDDLHDMLACLTVH